MPEDKEKVAVVKPCPNCSTALEVTEQGLYCTPCDLTFTNSKGRVKVEAGGKGRLQEIEESVMILQNEHDKIKKAVFGNNEPFWMS